MYVPQVEFGVSRFGSKREISIPFPFHDNHFRLTFLCRKTQHKEGSPLARCRRERKLSYTFLGYSITERKKRKHERRNEGKARLAFSNTQRLNRLSFFRFLDIQFLLLLFSPKQGTKRTFDIRCHISSFSPFLEGNFSPSSTFPLLLSIGFSFVLDLLCMSSLKSRLTLDTKSGWMERNKDRKRESQRQRKPSDQREIPLKAKEALINSV